MPAGALGNDPIAAVGIATAAAGSTTVKLASRMVMFAPGNRTNPTRRASANAAARKFKSRMPDGSGRCTTSSSTSVPAAKALLGFTVNSSREELGHHLPRKDPECVPRSVSSVATWPVSMCARSCSLSPATRVVVAVNVRPTST